MDQRIPVDLRRRREQKSGVLGHGEPEGLMGAKRAHFERLNRQLEVVDRACRAREMEYAVERALDLDVARDVLIGEAEASVSREMREVIGVAGDVVVHSQHIVPKCQESVDQM